MRVTFPRARLSQLTTIPRPIAAFRHPLSTSRALYQQRPTNPHSNFYRTHGRALFKALTLAFLSYQFFYWTWLTFETEAMKDEKNGEIESLKSEVRLLEEGRRSHSPAEVLKEQEQKG